MSVARAMPQVNPPTALITCWKRADAPHGKYESLNFNSGWTDLFIYLKPNDYFTLF
jgi:hypothetical protein